MSSNFRMSHTNPNNCLLKILWILIRSGKFQYKIGKDSPLLHEVIDRSFYTWTTVAAIMSLSMELIYIIKALSGIWREECTFCFLIHFHCLVYVISALFLGLVGSHLPLN